MDLFINSASELSKVLLPILGVVVLIVLILILLKVLKIVEKTCGSLDNVDKLLVDVDKTIEKVQAPVDTVVKICGTIESVHDAGVNAAEQVKEFVTDNIEVIKEKVSGFKKEDSIKDDIVSQNDTEVVYEEDNNL